MRVIVFGSRNWSQRKLIRDALVQLGPGPHTIVHGNCRGADQIADKIALELGLTTEHHPAMWQSHGNAGGPIRNQEMVNLGAELALGFGTGGRGSQDMLKRLRATGINVAVYDIAAPEEKP